MKKKLLETSPNWDSPGYESEEIWGGKQEMKRQPKKNQENEVGFANFVIFILLQT